MTKNDRGILFSIIGIVVILALAIFNAKFSVEHFEDGSGIITMAYCVPFTLCGE